VSKADLEPVRDVLGLGLDVLGVDLDVLEPVLDVLEGRVRVLTTTPRPAQGGRGGSSPVQPKSLFYHA